jgi:hypothetical protein
VQSQDNTNLFWDNTTKRLGIGTATPSSDLSLGGNAARVIASERHTTADTAGQSLTVKAGSATLAATNKAGGDLILAPGIATGSAGAGLQLQSSTPGGAGTTDRAPDTKWRVSGAGHLLAETDNAHDIGATGATRPRDLFVARNTLIGGTLGVTGAVSLTVPLGTAQGGTSTAAAPTDGQVLIGSTGVGYVPAALTAGTGITLTPGAGSLSIAAAPGMTLIQEQILGGAVAGVSFAGIAGTYRHLRLIVVAREATAADAVTFLRVTFNNDTGNNYADEHVNATGASVSAGEANSVAFMRLGLVPQDSADANAMGGAVIDIPYYSKTDNLKSAVANSLSAFGLATGQHPFYHLYGFWASAAAITEIDLVCATGGNFKVGSYFALYGVA